MSCPLDRVLIVTLHIGTGGYSIIFSSYPSIPFLRTKYVKPNEDKVETLREQK